MTYRQPEKQNEFQRNWQRKVRALNKEKIVALLGGCCGKCGYREHLAALHIDHIKPLRRKDRSARSKTSGSTLIREVLRGKLSSKEVQLLCANCHAIKTFTERELM